MRRAWTLLVLAASVAAILVATAAAASAPMRGLRRTPVSMRSTARIACAPVYWRTEDGDQRCPSSHSVLADSSDTDLHWTMWTRTQADGYGDVLALDAVPGPRHDSSVQPFKVKLTHVRHCPDGRWIYTRSSETIYATLRTIGPKARVPLMRAKGRIATQSHPSYGCNPTPPGSPAP